MTILIVSRFWRAVSLLMLLVSASAAHSEAALMALSEFPRSSLTIITPDARQHVFDVWVASDDRHREQGLMGVKALPPDTGMLFVLDHPQPVAMWMKDTPLPLDMLFIDADGRVQHLIHHATPLSLKILSSRGSVLGVLELQGGTAKALNITPGSLVKHRAFASLPGSR